MSKELLPGIIKGYFTRNGQIPSKEQQIKRTMAEMKNLNTPREVESIIKNLSRKVIFQHTKFY